MFHGEDVFRLMDTCGVPLDTTRQAILGKAGFDLGGFIVAARESGNYSEQKLEMLLVCMSSGEAREFAAKALALPHEKLRDIVNGYLPEGMKITHRSLITKTAGAVIPPPTPVCFVPPIGYNTLKDAQEHGAYPGV